MRIKRFLVCIIVIFALHMPYAVNADTDDAIKIAGDENYPPYEFVDRSGAYKGFNIDIMKAIAADLGIDIEFEPMPWTEAVKALDNKKVDVVQGMNRSAAREQSYSFTKPTAQSSQVIFVRSETNNISEISNLIGLRVAMQSGDICEEILKSVPEIQVVIFSNQEQAMKALLDKKVDAFVGNRLTGLYILQNFKQFNKIKIVGEPLCNTEYCSAVLKENPRVLELLDKGLEDIRKSGEYERIYHKWFGETIDNYRLYWQRFMIFGGAALVLILGVTVLVVFWNRSLRRLVAKRTSELHIQQEKQEQSNRLRGKILENILDGIIAFDKDGFVLGANKTAKEMFGMDDIEGHTIEEIASNGSFVAEGYEQALLGGIWHRDIVWEKNDDEVLNIDCNVYPIKGPDDIVEGMIVVLHDYTEAKLLNEAKEYDKLKTEFFANMSHEFRTPLSVILAASQLLELKAKNSKDGELGSAVSKTVSSIKQNINRLTRLVNNIIDVTRADTGYLQLQLKNQNIVNIIEEATLSVADLIENKGISIQFDTDVEEKIIACDADKIEKIVLNLLSNSVKFTPEGGFIYVNVKEGTDFVTVCVKDTGVGIPKDKQDIIFDRFRQVDKSISRRSEGSGIGLSLVKSLVELHGGTIRVESEYGSGSEFIIKLPSKQLGENPDDLGTELVNTVKVETEFSDIYL